MVYRLCWQIVLIMLIFTEFDSKKVKNKKREIVETQKAIKKLKIKLKIQEAELEELQMQE